jgi:hypothetical protein
MRFEKTGYFKPTAKKMRQLGIAFKATAALAVPAVMSDYKWVGIILFCVGIAGEFMTNFFTDDKEEENKNK